MDPQMEECNHFETPFVSAGHLPHLGITNFTKLEVLRRVSTCGKLHWVTSFITWRSHGWDGHRGDNSNGTIGDIAIVRAHQASTVKYHPSFCAGHCAGCDFGHSCGWISVALLHLLPSARGYQTDGKVYIILYYILLYSIIVYYIPL